MLQNKSTVGSGTNFIGRIGASLTRWSMKYMPDCVDIGHISGKTGRFIYDQILV